MYNTRPIPNPADRNSSCPLCLYGLQIFKILEGNHSAQAFRRHNRLDYGARQTIRCGMAQHIESIRVLMGKKDA